MVQPIRLRVIRPVAAFLRSPRVRAGLRLTAAALVSAWVFLFYLHLLKPLPEGVSLQGPLRPASEMQFIYDLTYQHQGERVVDQQIFNRISSMIRAADEFIVLDMFLFNAWGRGEEDFRPLAGQLTRNLIRRKRDDPSLHITFITDELNNFYGAYTSPEISALREAGIEVVTTRMEGLRDSNPLFSTGWRLLPGRMRIGGTGWLPDLVNRSEHKVTVRSYLKLLNLKANHRKLLITDKECMVSSANPHDQSSFHSNIAFVGSGPICGDLLEAEKAVASLSGADVSGWPVYGVAQERPAPGAGTVQLVTEGEILRSLLEDLAAAGTGDTVDLAMFYLSERKVVEALVAADARGASVRLVLDPNKDAFGLEKNGIPNRQVARELVNRSEGRILVRWYDTHGEQFHTKLVMVTRGDTAIVMGGSANLTRRNIRDYNLEAGLRFEVPAKAPLAVAVSRYFERIFTNRDAEFTLPLEAYPDRGWLKRIVYRIQELTGLCTY